VDRDHTGLSKRSEGMVICTRTRAAGDQNDIGVGGHDRFTNSSNGGIDAVLVSDETAVASNQAGEQWSICIVDGPGREGRPGFDHIASSQQATRARTLDDRNLAYTGRHQKANVSGAHFVARLREPASPDGLAAAAFDVSAGNNRLQNAAGSIASVRELIQGSHRIGSARQPVARVYERASGLRKIVVVRHRPKRKRTVNARANSLIGANGEPIDGCTVKRWQVDFCRHVIGQNPAQSMRDTDVFRGQRSHLAIDPGQHVLKPCPSG
jgi:hypothetical protein